MKRYNQSFVFLLCSFFILSNAFSAIKLPHFFSDNMVLQQQAKALIWGWSTAGTKVTLISSWDKKKYELTADEKGKWKTNLVTPSAGGPFAISIKDEDSSVTIKNILIGEVWLCSGQSNMEMQMKGSWNEPILGSTDDVFNSDNGQIRLYTVPKSLARESQDISGKATWNAADPGSVANFSAAAYYFGRLLQQKLKVPVGLVCISYGGTPVESFMDEEALKRFPEITSFPSKTDTSQKISNQNATTIYNGMMHPFLGYALKGCIWYQGESNNGRAKQYEDLLPAFVKMLRTKSNNDNLSFYYVQIAPYKYNKDPDSAGNWNSAFLRDAQRKALEKIPNSGMVVTMDVGSEYNIHPWDKETIGKRLAYMALGKTYGINGVTCESPLYKAVSFNDNMAIIEFSNAANGLTTYGKPLNNFEIAGDDKIFHPGNAKISRGKLEVSSPDVPKPVAVRYAFKDFVMGELFNMEGFPASSFRTDDW